MAPQQPIVRMDASQIRSATQTGTWRTCVAAKNDPMGQRKLVPCWTAPPNWPAIHGWRNESKYEIGETTSASFVSNSVRPGDCEKVTTTKKTVNPISVRRPSGLVSLSAAPLRHSRTTPTPRCPARPMSPT